MSQASLASVESLGQSDQCASIRRITLSNSGLLQDATAYAVASWTGGTLAVLGKPAKLSRIGFCRAGFIESSNIATRPASAMNSNADVRHVMLVRRDKLDTWKLVKL